MMVESYTFIIIRPRMGPSLGFVTNVFYSAQNGSESRFRDKCFFFSVDLCYILWSVLLHHLICIAPLAELIAPL